MTIWLTEDCNLRCTYCYVSKHPRYLKEEMIPYIAHFFEQQAILHENELLHVDFHGGEPLLNFKLLKRLVHIFTLIGKKHDAAVRYHITTNGTLLSDDYLNFLIENNFNISVSVDGQKEQHDSKRKYKDGKGSFSKVFNNLSKVQKLNKHVRVRMTLTTDTVGYYYENYKFFFEKGFTGVVAIPDTTQQKWSKTDVQEYYIQQKKILSYLRENHLENFQYYLHNMEGCSFRKLGKCDGGKDSFQISPTGMIYPCSMIVGNLKFSIGNVVDGLDNQKVAAFAKEYEIDNVACGSCILKDRCDGNRCKYINYAVNEDFHQASGAMCNIHQKDYHLLKEMLQYGK